METVKVLISSSNIVFTFNKRSKKKKRVDGRPLLLCKDGHIIEFTGVQGSGPHRAFV